GVDSGVDVGCTIDNATQILAAIPDPDALLDGATPSGEAIVNGLDYLAGLGTTGPKAMIFMADGATAGGCAEPNSWPEIVPVLQQAYNQGVAPSIPTYVV